MASSIITWCLWPNCINLHNDIVFHMRNFFRKERRRDYRISELEASTDFRPDFAQASVTYFVPATPLQLKYLTKITSASAVAYYEDMCTVCDQSTLHLAAWK